jgi:phosphoglycerate dehydrogenase-like enzyme
MNVVFDYPCGPWLAERLADLGNEGLSVTVCAEDDEAKFCDTLADADVLWHVLKPVTAEHIQIAARLRLIQKIGVGVNTIDLEAAHRRDIAVCNMPGSNSVAVAEMTLALMLAVLRKIAVFDSRLRKMGAWNWPVEWQAQLGELAGCTIGLVGFGAVPQKLAPILDAMGAHVVYTGRRRIKDISHPFLEKSELLATADIVSLHIPETGETRNWLDRDAIALMKPGAVVINTARGGLIDELALIEALDSGHLSGAGLDVFAVEPVVPSNRLLEIETVVAQPHIAWFTRGTIERSLAAAVENTRRLAVGGKLMNQVV